MYRIFRALLTKSEPGKSIENSLHWVLDVTIGKDAYPIYPGNAAEILA
jgi:hypothetical protein